MNLSFFESKYPVPVNYENKPLNIDYLFINKNNYLIYSGRCRDIVMRDSFKKVEYLAFAIKNDKLNIVQNIVNFINSAEKLFKIPNTQFQIFKHQTTIVPNIIICKLHKLWLISPVMISLYLFLIRLGALSNLNLNYFQNLNYIKKQRQKDTDNIFQNNSCWTQIGNFRKQLDLSYKLLKAAGKFGLSTFLNPLTVIKDYTKVYGFVEYCKIANWKYITNNKIRSFIKNYLKANPSIDFQSSWVSKFNIEKIVKG